MKVFVLFIIKWLKEFGVNLQAARRTRISGQRHGAGAGVPTFRNNLAPAQGPYYTYGFLHQMSSCYSQNNIFVI